MRYRVLPYRQGSRAAKSLATALGGKVLKLEGSKFKVRHDDVIINWGSTDTEIQPYLHPIINPPSAIIHASNKKNFFLAMQESCPDVIPRFWTSSQDIPDDAFPVVCRTVLAGHSGDGIVIADSRGELVSAPLYVEYKKKQDEYRIHVGLAFGGVRVIAVQRKARRNGFENPNWQVRNHQNGFVYVREGVNPPEQVIEYAKRSLLATGLDFGAVDVIYNQKENRAYVLEINTAPGLEGQTVTDYANFFQTSASD